MHYVLIGPASHILDYQYDFAPESIICRVGDVFPLGTRIIQATGKHTDYWYPANQLLDQKPEICACPDIRWIRTTGLGAKAIPEAYKYKWQRTSWNLSAIQAEIGCMPNRGLRAIIDILHTLKAKSLHIIGITFYRGGLPYYEGYTTDQVMQDHIRTKGDMGGHLQNPQIEYFLKHIKPLPHVTWDEELEEVLNRYQKEKGK